MTIEHWLMMAAIISTLIAPTLQTLVQSRINQPKPAPDPSQPKNRSQRIKGWFIRLIESPWRLPLLSIVVYIYLLFTELRDTRPVTRGTILAISIGVAGIWFSIVSGFTNQIWRAIIRRDANDAEVRDILRSSVGVSADLFELVRKLSVIVLVSSESASKATQPARGALDKLLSAMRKLLRD